MIVGFDTGYFVRLLEGNETAVNVWEDLTDGNIEAVVSSLTFFELKRLGLKGQIDNKSLETLFEAIKGICHIVWLDDIDMLTFSAGLSYGNGIPAIDSIILAGCLSMKTEKIYTTDSHFEAYKKKSISIIKM
ncbi:MAG: type II toxin-antitoxin system VapC family toxin [bacterium]|nr:type II toxin-antitoxin system VapC family toxin [bacterium]